MTLAEILDRYERRKAEAEAQEATAPVARVYALVLEELRAVDGAGELDRLLTTEEAGQALGVSPVTVARKCAEGVFEGARKTSGDTGEWRIPARAVYEQTGVRENGGDRTKVPRLWRPS